MEYNVYEIYFVLTCEQQKEKRDKNCSKIDQNFLFHFTINGRNLNVEKLSEN